MIGEIPVELIAKDKKRKKPLFVLDGGFLKPHIKECEG
jgi:hypothetical protein